MSVILVSAADLANVAAVCAEYGGQRFVAWAVQLSIISEANAAAHRASYRTCYGRAVAYSATDICSHDPYTGDLRRARETMCTLRYNCISNEGTYAPGMDTHLVDSAFLAILDILTGAH